MSLAQSLIKFVRVEMQGNVKRFQIDIINKKIQVTIISDIDVWICIGPFYFI